MPTLHAKLSSESACKAVFAGHTKRRFLFSAWVQSDSLSLSCIWYSRGHARDRTYIRAGSNMRVPPSSERGWPQPRHKSLKLLSIHTDNYSCSKRLAGNQVRCRHTGFMSLLCWAVRNFPHSTKFPRSGPCCHRHHHPKAQDAYIQVQQSYR